MNNYIIRSYGFVIVVTRGITRRTIKLKIIYSNVIKHIKNWKKCKKLIQPANNGQYGPVVKTGTIHAGDLDSITGAGRKEMVTGLLDGIDV